MAYLLDSNVFIQAKNLHYGFDFCPAFWEWLDKMNAQRKVFSIQQVGTELKAGNDELSAWCDGRDDEFFLLPDNQVLATAPRVSGWATGQGYAPAAVNTFLQVADYWLVAYAAAHGHIVVTHEQAANTVNKIKIPNACVGLGIRFMTPFQMLQAERARFVLGPLPRDEAAAA